MLFLSKSNDQDEEKKQKELIANELKKYNLENKSSFSIRFWLISINIFFVILFAAILSSYAAYGIKTRGEEEIDNIRKTMQSEKNNFLITEAHQALNYLKVMNDAGIDDDTIKNGLLSFNHLKKDIYFFAITNPDGIMIVHPKKSLVGTSVFDMKDKKGNYLFQNMIKIASEKNKGFVTYFWSKPGEKEPQPKLTYVINFPEKNWVVGMGVYVDDIDKAVLNKQIIIKNNINKEILGNIIISLLCVIVLALVMIISITNYFSKRINVFEKSILEYLQMGGDLTKDFQIVRYDEMGRLGIAFNMFLRKIRDSIRFVMKNEEKLIPVIKNLENSASKIAQSTKKIKVDVENISSNTEVVSASTNQLNIQVESTASSSKDSANYIEAANNEAETGLRYVKDLSEQMNQIQDSSGKMSAIVTVITDITNQTNLLSLNAAIEAAKAGEMGKGFAVVADEVRRLAERSSGATQEILELIQESTDRINSGTAQVEELNRSLEVIVEKISGTNELIQQISTAQSEQAIGLREIHVSLESLTTSVNEIADETTQSEEESKCESEIAGHLKNIFEELDKSVHQFRV